METVKNFDNIPVEKFAFTKKTDLKHDSKFETKPVTYFQGAMKRFCKNKGAVVGAIVILFLFIFAIIGPLVSPYTVSYYDVRFKWAQPRNELCVKWGWDFWDGCQKKKVNYIDYIAHYALGVETGKEVIKNNEYTIDENGLYSYRLDTYYGVGFGDYKDITVEEYNDIQKYQDETGNQVLYPIVAPWDRPTSIQHNKNANIYYKTEIRGNKAYPVLDANGNLILNYWTYTVSEGLPIADNAAPYSSKLKIEGENGTTLNGEQAFYVYGEYLSGGVRVRADYYEYYRYYHNYVLKDGIERPNFIFGTTEDGKDIFTCLSSGAWFSFMFGISVAVVNLFVGAIYGSIAGYFGGKVDLFMERFTDILGSVPMMIIISLLRLHMGDSGHALILFIAFFATGWISMAGTTRMQFYRFKNQEYVLAARTLGARDGRIMFKHIFPNAIGTLVTSSALVIPTMIYSETNFSYLGILSLESGNLTSVGTMLAAGQNQVFSAPFVAVFPCVFLAMLMLSFNLFGNGLRDAFNPSLRGAED